MVGDIVADMGYAFVPTKLDLKSLEKGIGSWN
jgi:hypothetical protein